MTQLDVTRRAARDADEIFHYLTSVAGPRTAERHFLRIQKTIERLADWPETAQRRPDLGRDVRLAVVAPFIVIYRYEPEKDVLTILRILHGRRNVTDRMINPSERT
jgi:toxin ParE1/3/4